MKNYELLDAVGGINPEYIENAAKNKTWRKKPIWKMLVPAAACLCVLIGGIVFFNHNEGVHPSTDITQSELSAHNNLSTTDTNSPSSQQEQIANADYFGPIEELDDGNNQQPITPMISSYGESAYAGDMVVYNGAYVLSDSLKGALQEYGNTAKYRVIVELFTDGVQLDNASETVQAEINRLANEGYIVAFETYNDGNVDHKYFTLHAEFDQLNDFCASDALGYFILLYGEYFCTEDSSVNENIFSEAHTYSSEILDLQNRISAAMANNELPFVTCSSVLENPDRIHVTVNTMDEESINRLKAFDTSGKLLEIEYMSGLPIVEQ